MSDMLHAEINLPEATKDRIRARAALRAAALKTLYRIRRKFLCSALISMGLTLADIVIVTRGHSELLSRVVMTGSWVALVLMFMYGRRLTRFKRTMPI